MRDPTKMFNNGTALFLYNETRKWFALGSGFLVPVLLIINAPFGRFTPKNQSSFLLVDGIKSWIVMELVSPAMFIYNYYTSPLTMNRPPLFPPGSSLLYPDPVSILAVCFLAHYVNRALVSPLRTPSRSKTHLIVPLAGIVFNVLNGSLLGAYFSSPFTRMYHLSGIRPQFYIGLAIWALGLVGNIYHDEILMNIRRKAQLKGKGRDDGAKGEHYSIPTGGLYRWVSYPNYLCEWIEWLGFAIAAGPFPFDLSHINLATLAASLLNVQTYKDLINTPASNFAPNLSPPWIFLVSEVLLMLPRAYRGHQWYHTKFGDSYPKERKAAIPFIL
ncbi:hypothetical protein D9619_005466 [Psilocybe cf. subviscida]|uniref:3-oxo-5-alpha-steroid 4-dehydrogenase C-terminal domain-containing protein n=1 Tax=Psilocybe cf. subviscida TaxID=2480587 RepID=A0A8H5FBK1_9AGAR|nr:hypothetical protein D9619_005466 [Psilocybe cf. subviscida]